jgi:hypothetical protein
MFAPFLLNAAFPATDKLTASLPWARFRHEYPGCQARWPSGYRPSLHNFALPASQPSRHLTFPFESTAAPPPGFFEHQTFLEESSAQ